MRHLCRGRQRRSSATVRKRHSSSGTSREFLASKEQSKLLRSEMMGLLFYLFLFILTCAFGWWAKGASQK